MAACIVLLYDVISMFLIIVKSAGNVKSFCNNK